MGQRRQHHHNNKRQNRPASAAPVLARPAFESIERKPKVTYGKAFILLEDAQKNVFVFNAGQWVQYEKSIAQCRQDCQVKELPQRINNMTRYEVSEPLASGA
jgi:hypothetical protein